MTALADHVVESERALRLSKLEALRSRGIEPYPATFAGSEPVAAVRERFAGLSADARTGAPARIAGRLMLIRRHGGMIFATLTDQSGSIQLLASRAALGDEAFADVEALGRGDWVGAVGTVMATHTGELTIDVSEVRLLSKALRALPDKHRGLTGTEARLRERHLDLIANPHTRQTFDVRSAVVASVRSTLVERGFVEVETPVLEQHAGGAAARPFVTHHNSLNADMVLRIALELSLKRLVVGGFERVFELGRVFRNEGLDPSHNPEFTLLEAYQALADYRDMMELVETIVSRTALAANGTTLITLDGQTVDLAPPWRRATMAELISEQTGERMHPAMGIEAARAICDRLGISYEPGWGAGRLMSEVYEETAEHTLVAPTFVLDHPRETSPLAKAHRDDDTLVERFEAVVGGRELANAYSELNDPVDQRERFAAQGEVDEDYVRALEYGLPPTGGLGIGIDRLVMLIAGATSIREVVLFPALRPEHVVGAAAPARAANGRLARAADGPVAPRLAAASPAAGPAPPVLAAASSAAGSLARPTDEPLPSAAPAPSRRRRAPAVLGALTALAGVLAIVEHLVAVAHVSTVVIGFVLLLVAAPLRRGKRRAWGVAVALFGAAVVVRAPDLAVAGPALGMLLALVWHRDAFTSCPDPGSLRDVLRFIPIWLGVALAFTVGSLLLGGEHVTARGVVDTSVLGLAGSDGDALLALGLAGLAILALLAFRAVRAHGASSTEEQERARALVHSYGDDTLDYFALRPDKSYFFNRAGDAMLAYRFLAGHALVAGDPIGAPGAREQVVGEFIAHCRGRGWRVAFLGARERDLPLYEHHGLRGIYLGDEAVIRCDEFSLAGGAMKSVRSAVSRVGRECTFSLLRETEASPVLRSELNALRERWRDGEDERGFTMELGGGVRGEDPNLLLAVATAPDGRPLGFLRLVPCCGDEPGWSLDLMQHDPAAPNGMTEYLIAMTAQELGARGYRRLSLNFATWGRLFAPDAQLTLPQRAQRRLAEVLSPYFQITSLRTFNAKFDPEWVSRSIVVEDLEDATKVGLLYAMVEGFLNVPLIGSRLVPIVEPS